MSDFLLELLSEEIPARMQARARNDLARMMAEMLAAAGLEHDGITTYSTPRRLALIAVGLPLATEAVSEEVKGPRSSAPPQALDGFLRKTGLTRDQLEQRDGVWFAKIDKPGRATAEVLAEAVAAIVRDFPWPKSMRWGAASASTASLRWVRPLHLIVALLGEEIVPVAIEGVACGAATLGHRFHHPGVITIGGAHDYVEKLRACHVLVDQAEREAIVRAGAIEAAENAGFRLVEDEGLVVENAGLTEWPVPLLGSFDADYLDVPEEVIALTARTNQKYFVMRDGAGKLAPHFVCTANIDANDGGAAIVAGNERVLAARLSDARFFWQQDVKVPLEEQAKKLEQIVFHDKLGTVADKVERVAKLARWLVEEGIVTSPLPQAGGDEGGPVVPPSKTDIPFPNPSREREGDLAAQAERAARLAKADLVTGMVGEFPELQGVIGGYLARAQGEDDAVADAIRDHYKPVGQGDEVPTAPVTVAVSLADKLDTLVSFFLINERPTGSRDPYALRRAAIGILSLIIKNGLRVRLQTLTTESYRYSVSTLATNFWLIPIDHEDSMTDHEAIEPSDAYRVSLPLAAIRNDFTAERFGKTFGHPMLSEFEISESSLDEFVVPDLDDADRLIRHYLFDRIEETQRGACRHDLIRSVISKPEVIFDFETISFDGPPIRQKSRKKGKGVSRYRKKDPNQIDDVNSILSRVQALQAFVETSEGANLLAAYKRAANILKKENWSGGGVMDTRGSQGIAQTGEEDPLSEVEEPAIAEAVAEMAERRAHPQGPLAPEEAALIAALDVAGPKAELAVEAEDFTGAMAALASLRAPIDAFFEKVIVNDADGAVRARRLNLLARFRDAVHRVADFSRIEG